MTTSSGTGNTAPSLTTATVLLALWALLSYLVRVWVRWRKSDNWGRDDTSISLAALVLLGNVITTCFGIHNGYGNPWASLSTADNVSIRRSLYAGQILYVITIGITRISASYFTARFLARDKSHDRVANAFTWLCGLWTLASVFIVAVRSPYSIPWTTVEGSNLMFIRWLIVEALGVMIDLLAIVVAVYLVWTLQMSVGKRLLVCMIFCCRMLAIPLIVLRLFYLHPSHNSSYLTKPDLRANITTQAVLNATFILASITCLKPFLRPFHSNFSISIMDDPARNPSGWERPSKLAPSRRDTLYEMTSSGTSNKRKTMVSVHSHVDDPEWADDQDLIRPHQGDVLILRPDRCVERRTNISGGQDQYGDEYNKRNGIMVSTTSTWNVTYHE